jgi:hypothetical protein
MPCIFFIIFSKKLQIIKKKNREERLIMKIRIITIIMLCMSLFAFAGCGENGNTNADMNNNTVTEETRNTTERDNAGTTNNNDQSIADDMADGVDKAADDVAEGIDDVTDSNNKDAKRN